MMSLTSQYHGRFLFCALPETSFTAAIRDITLWVLKVLFISHTYFPSALQLGVVHCTSRAHLLTSSQKNTYLKGITKQRLNRYLRTTPDQPHQTK